MLPPIMAVNGPPNGEVELHLPISPDASYYHPSPPSPILSKSSPPDPPSPGPASPGKKRVRISDSTSVRVIEDPPIATRRPAVSQHRTYYHQFNSEYHSRLHAENTSPSRGPPRHSSSHGEEDDHVGKSEEDAGSREYDSRYQSEEYDRDYHQDDSGVDVQEYVESASRVEERTCPEDVSSTEVQSLDDLRAADTEPPLLTLPPFRDPDHRIFLVSDHLQEPVKTSALEGRQNGALYVIDSITGWPLKRSPSLESRDNPFLPGGDLSREAEDLLSNATIVRDKFYLHQQQRPPGAPSAAADPSSDPSRPAAPRSPQDAADGALLRNSKHPAAVEERIIAPTSASAAGLEARPDPHPRENGKAGSDGVSSPDGVRVEVEGAAEGGKGAGSDSDEGEKDKPKRRAKCCVVM